MTYVSITTMPAASDPVLFQSVETSIEQATDCNQYTLTDATGDTNTAMVMSSVSIGQAVVRVLTYATNITAGNDITCNGEIDYVLPITQIAATYGIVRTDI